MGCKWQLTLEVLAEKAESAMQQGSMICNATTSSCVKGLKRQLALRLLVEIAESTVQQTGNKCNAAKRLWQGRQSKRQMAVGDG